MAAAGIHFEHKSCAVKLHAYTLDNSANNASALQQKMPLPPLTESFCFGEAHDKGCAPIDLFFL
jgi:hypothetical protein